MRFRLVLALSCIAVFASSARAQTREQLAGWDRVQSLSPLTKVHVSSDMGGTTCRIFAVSAETLTCATGPGSSVAGRVFQRSTIKSIKGTRRLVSTLVGLGAGVGIGLGIGRALNPPQPNSFIDLSGLAVAASGVLGGVGGTIVGASTDMLRGPTIYVRP